MTDRWRGVWLFAAFGAALVLLLHVAAGCDDGDRTPAPDAAAMDSGGGSDAPGTDAGGLSDAPPPPDASPSD